MKVSKWGNSLAIRLPAEVVAKHGIKEGDEVEASIRLKQDAETAARRKRIDEAWQEFDRVVGRIEMPMDYKFDRDEANSRD